MKLTKFSRGKHEDDVEVLEPIPHRTDAEVDDLLLRDGLYQIGMMALQRDRRQDYKAAKLFLETARVRLQARDGRGVSKHVVVVDP